MSRTVQRASLHRCAFALATALACGGATIAHAEVRVEGSPEAVRVTTSQDRIADVLSAFAATFDVKYRSAIPLDAVAGANYSGSFGQVISRLLDGYNYAIKREQGTIEIVVFGTRGQVAIPPPAPKPKSLLSQWR
jgi:hypothetical protein